MAMGSAYAAGAGMVQKEESYVPLTRSYIDMARTVSDRSGMRGRAAPRARGGGGGAAAETQRRRLRMEEQEAERARQAEWSRRNQYMAAHHGREPTPEEMADVEYGREAEQKGLERGERARQFDVTAAAQEKERGLRREELARKKEDVSGLKKREDIRRQEKHGREMTKADIEIDKERRTADFDNMMEGFLTGRYEAVEEYFKRSGKGEAPMLGHTDDPDMVEVKFPGQPEPQLISKDMLGQLFSRMNPKFEERPKRKKPEKRMSRKDAAKEADKYAKGVSERGDQTYEEAYRERYSELTEGDAQERPRERQPRTRGKIFEQKASSLLKQIQETTRERVIRTRVNRKTGEMELTFEGGRKEVVRVD